MTNDSGGEKPPPGTGLAALLRNIKDIVTSIAGIITVGVPALAALGIGFTVGHATALPPSSPKAPSTTASSPQPSTDAPTPSDSTSSAAGKVYLSTLKPVESPYASVVAGPVQFGTTTYQHSIRFTCVGSASSVIYNVAGYKFLDATLDVPNDATNAASNNAVINFLKNGTTIQLGQPLIDVIGQPQTIHLDLQGAAQLDITCAATDARGSNQSMDIAFGDASIGSS